MMQRAAGFLSLVLSFAILATAAIVGQRAALGAPKWEFDPALVAGVQSPGSSEPRYPGIVEPAIPSPPLVAALPAPAPLPPDIGLAAPVPAGPMAAVDTAVKQANFELPAGTVVPAGCETCAKPCSSGSSCCPTGNPCCEELLDRTWYARVDYFRWNERIEGTEILHEDGALVTLGYVRRRNAERFRAEVFGGEVDYWADMSFISPGEVLSSHTDYLGVRGEYELVADPETVPGLSFFAGLGTRFWIRDLPDAETNFGTPILGYTETWWTIYPYLGIETRRRPVDDWQFYGAGRIGLTAVTLMRATVSRHVLWPEPGITAQAEGGIRGRRMFVGTFFEAMAWGESDPSGGWFQPASAMYEVGVKGGWWF